MAPVRNGRGRSTLSEIQSPQVLSRHTRGRGSSLEDEQIRKDEELARRLASGQIDALADQTLSPEEIAAILGNDYDEPRNTARVTNARNPVASVNVRRQSTTHSSRQPAADLGYGYRANRGQTTVVTIQRQRSYRQVIHVQQTDDNDTRTEVQINDDDPNGTIDVSDEESEDESDMESDDDHDGHPGGDSFIVNDDDDVQVLDSDSDEDDEDDDDLDESVRDVYQGELELLDDDLPTTSRNPRTSTGVVHRLTALRTDKYGHCTICFEDKPADPMSCIHCKQLVGCDACVQQWWNAGVEAKKRGPQTFADGPPPNNHFQCPLCRHTWKRKPQVVSSAKY